MTKTLLLPNASLVLLWWRLFAQLDTSTWTNVFPTKHNKDKQIQNVVASFRGRHLVSRLSVTTTKTWKASGFGSRAFGRSTSGASPTTFLPSLLWTWLALGLPLCPLVPVLLLPGAVIGSSMFGNNASSSVFVFLPPKALLMHQSQKKLSVRLVIHLSVTESRQVIVIGCHTAHQFSKFHRTTSKFWCQYLYPDPTVSMTVSLSCQYQQTFLPGWRFHCQDELALYWARQRWQWRILHDSCCALQANCSRWSAQGDVWAVEQGPKLAVKSRPGSSKLCSAFCTNLLTANGMPLSLHLTVLYYSHLLLVSRCCKDTTDSTHKKHTVYNLSSGCTWDQPELLNKNYSVCSCR